MRFQIKGLDPAVLSPLFDDDAALAARGGRRVIADEAPGYPCRISLADAAPGEPVLLVPFEHHATASPYRGVGPIYVRRDVARYDAPAVPPMLRARVLSVRGYDAAGMLRDAALCPGAELEPAIDQLFADREIAYLHVHFARTGCFACRVDRG